MWTKPSTTRASVHSGHTAVRIKGWWLQIVHSPMYRPRLKLTDWLVPMKAACISEVSVHREKETGS